MWQCVMASVPMFRCWTSSARKSVAPVNGAKRWFAITRQLIQETIADVDLDPVMAEVEGVHRAGLLLIWSLPRRMASMSPGQRRSAAGRWCFLSSRSGKRPAPAINGSKRPLPPSRRAVMAFQAGNVFCPNRPGNEVRPNQRPELAVSLPLGSHDPQESHRQRENNAAEWAVRQIDAEWVSAN